MKKWICMLLVTILLTATALATSATLSPMDSLFFYVDMETTYDEAMEYIASSGLYYSEKEYNGSPKTISIVVSDVEGAARHTHAEFGNKITLSFDKGTHALMYMEYTNAKTICSALVYSYGTYWDFREKAPGNTYSGFYYHDPMDFDEGGIVIVYPNGNKAETNYYPYPDKEMLWEVVF